MIRLIRRMSQTDKCAWLSFWGRWAVLALCVFEYAQYKQDCHQVGDLSGVQAKSSLCRI